MRAHLLNGTVKRGLADTTGMYQGVPATIETCQMLLQSEVGLALSQGKLDQGLGSLERTKLLGSQQGVCSNLCLPKQPDSCCHLWVRAIAALCPLPQALFLALAVASGLCFPLWDHRLQSCLILLLVLLLVLPVLSAASGT